MKLDDPDGKIDFLAAESLHGVGGLVFDAHKNHVVNELGRRDYVTGEMWKNNSPPSATFWTIASIILGAELWSSTSLVLHLLMGECPSLRCRVRLKPMGFFEKDLHAGRYTAYSSGKSWMKLPARRAQGRSSTTTSFRQPIPQHSPGFSLWSLQSSTTAWRSGNRWQFRSRGIRLEASSRPLRGRRGRWQFFSGVHDLRPCGKRCLCQVRVERQNEGQFLLLRMLVEWGVEQWPDHRCWRVFGQVIYSFIKIGVKFSLFSKKKFPSQNHIYQTSFSSKTKKPELFTL